MKLLIVDDQLATLKGLYQEVDWAAEGFTEVATAQNAMEARIVFKESIPDIMICDIEMPVESGIDLCRWVRAQEYNTEVIFLTCHSEFSYAKDAIELSAIDYILQPAPYEAIVTVVHKAIAAVEDNKRRKDALYKAGVYEGKKDYICQKMWNDFLLGVCGAERLLETVILPYPLKEICLLLIQLVGWKDRKKDWNESLISGVLISFLNDIFLEEIYYTVLVPVETDIYALIIQEKENGRIEQEKMLQQMKYLSNIFDMYMPCEAACYLTQASVLGTLPDVWKELRKMQARNVTCKAGVFTINDLSADKQSIPVERVMLWKEYLCLKQGNQMEQEATALLHNMAECGELNAESLMRFYQEFMQMLYQTEHEEGGVRVVTLFTTEESMELYRNGMKSLEGMLALIHYIAIAYLQTEEEQNEIVEKIKRYIINNLERNITKEEITKIVHLNTDYVTRLFKKETGMSIKSYIIQQKMLAAQNLLQNTAFSISHIAVRLGYSNFSHFAATYKKQFGLLPTEEKRKN